MTSVIAPDQDVFSYARTVMLRLMRERGVTQVALAPLLGMTQSSVSDRVRGRRRLDLEDIHHLAVIFDVEVAEFFPPRAQLSLFVRSDATGLLPSTFGQHRWSAGVFDVGLVAA